jgi:predicted RNase H-like nuclease (RuvC/YqgF family)
MKELTTIILGLIGLAGGGGGIWSVINLRATKAKMIADAQQTQANTATALGSFAVEVLLDPLKKRIGELEAEVAKLYLQVREAREAEAEVDRLKRKNTIADETIAELSRRIQAYEAQIAQLKAVIETLRGGGAVVVEPPN